MVQFSQLIQMSFNNVQISLANLIPENDPKLQKKGQSFYFRKAHDR